MFSLALRLLFGFSLALALAWAAPSETRNNLDSIIGNEKLKFVFVGGKGGVGKTTSSSAIASQLSLTMSSLTKSHKRVLLISTDPAHSLSDAFRMKFSNAPTPILPNLPNLEVMEVDPTVTMKKELSKWVELAKDMGYDPDNKDNKDADGGMGEKIHSFQEWLSGIPGIDEATALSSAIEHIESGRYDLIVFDTAPTGHTLKLLELPKILQVGLDKLESWQATLWGYWELIRGGGGEVGVKEKVAEKLKEYKASIGRVADMITDTERTRFVVVCIAEYLSISESRRLLGELDRHGVKTSHVVVNQLVTDYLEEPELNQLQGYAESDDDSDKSLILRKALAASRLTTARRNIQSKYLKDLKSCPEVNRKPDPDDPTKTNRKAGSEPLTVLEVPLLPSEVTGQKAILDFSHYLIGKDLSSTSSKSVGEDSNKQRRADQAAAEAKGSFAKKKPKKVKKSEDDAKLKEKANGMIDEVMKDPELAAMVNKSPKLKAIAEEVRQNPMAGLKYMGDPEVAPFLQKAMKMAGKVSGLGDMGGAGGGSRKGGKGKKGASPDPMAGLGALLGGLGGGKEGGKPDMAGLDALLGGLGKGMEL